MHASVCLLFLYKRARYFFLRGQEKVSKKKATLSLALRVPSHLGILRASNNSLRSNIARVYRKIPAMLGGG